MIKSFRDKETAALCNGKNVRKFSSFVIQAERRLEILDAATSLKDLSGLSGNRLEAFKGDRKGQYSIRINDRWRLCFAWHEGNTENAEIADYHRG